MLDGVEGHSAPGAWFVSRVCEEFGCTPDVAVTLDAALVERILELRSYARAKQLVEQAGADEAALARLPQRQVTMVFEIEAALLERRKATTRGNHG